MRSYIGARIVGSPIKDAARSCSGKIMAMQTVEKQLDVRLLLS